MNNKIIDLCKNYLLEIGVDKQVVEDSFGNIYQVLAHKLPKVCILKENRNNQGGNQTHIHITGKSMQFFYSKQELDMPTQVSGEDIKEELLVFKDNLISLQNRAKIQYDIDRQIDYDWKEDLIPTYTFKKIGRINTPPVQVQLSKIKLDDKFFMFLRQCLFIDDYLVFLKDTTNKIFVIGLPNKIFENNPVKSIFEEIELQSSIDYKRSSNLRVVDHTSIANFKSNDESDIEESYDLSNGINVRKKRTERHQDIVKLLAVDLERANYTLYENPVDCLAIKANHDVLLFEIKTLDGSLTDEKHQVRAAFSQLFYYEHFYVRNKFNKKICKFVLFESKISKEHVEFFEEHDITVLWLDKNHNIKCDDNQTFINLIKNASI